MSKCSECKYYGQAVDAPDTVENDCMWEMLREKDEDSTPPCCKE